MKCGNASTRPGKIKPAMFILLSGFAEHEHRPRKTLDQTAGDNAEHPEMPARSGENQTGAIGRKRLLFALFENRFDNFSFHLLALTIEPVELFGERLSPREIVCEK